MRVHGDWPGPDRQAGSRRLAQAGLPRGFTETGPSRTVTRVHGDWPEPDCHAGSPGCQRLILFRCLLYDTFATSQWLGIEKPLN